MIKEFSDTDAELARCIKSRMRHEYYSGIKDEKEIRLFLIELCGEIIEENFLKG